MPCTTDPREIEAVVRSIQSLVALLETRGPYIRRVPAAPATEPSVGAAVRAKALAQAQFLVRSLERRPGPVKTPAKSVS